MKFRTPKIKNLVLSFAIFAVVASSATTAWATLSFVKPEDAGYKVESGKISSLATLPEHSKSRAPEPSTMAIFASGLIGMMINFIQRAYAAAKRMFDVVVSSLAIIFLSPLFLLTAILIKITSRGPIFYTQTRVGRDGKHFEIYKFRTMKTDAEKDSGPVWARANDNRLIPVGSFLRKAHIDEIPQFLNVLRGEMSVVGPRPERPLFVNKFKEIISDYERRLEVKPGITGLAQVWHRYDETIEDVKKKIKYDLLYIRKLSLWTDILIFMRTFRVVLTGEGAR